MSVWMKVAHLKYKNLRGLYDIINTITDKSTSEQLSDIQNAGASAISDIQQAAADSQETVSGIDAQYSHMAAIIASVADHGTDDTLSQPGVAADAAATGVLKSAADSLSNIIDAVEIHETVSTPAAVMTITDGADNIPVDNLTVAVEPVQDLHGYEYPWPEGGGSNIMNPQTFLSGIQNSCNNSVTISGGDITLPNGANQVNSSIADRVKMFSGMFEANSSYTIFIASSNTDKALLTVFYTDGTSTILTSSRYNSTIQKYYLVTDSAKTIDYIRMNRDSTSPITYYTNKSGIFKGNIPASDYTPYSNICPISGWTEANVTRTGINIWDEEYVLGNFNNNTGGFVSGSYICSGFIPINDSTEYFASTPANAGIIIYYYGEEKENDYKGYTSKTNAVFTPSSGAKYMRFRTGVAYPGGTAYQNDISINYPATDTDYHPGNVQTVAVEFPSEAGTVYGGTLTVNQDGSGSLVVDRAIVDAGTLNWLYTSSIQGFRVNVPTMKCGEQLVCSSYKYSEAGLTAAPDICIWNKAYAYSAQNIVIKDSRYTDASTFIAAMSGVQLVYKLATPLTYDLTAIEVIETLKGTNRLWSDTGAIQSLTYSADPKLYIDNKIAHAVAAALNA